MLCSSSQLAPCSTSNILFSLNILHGDVIAHPQLCIRALPPCLSQDVLSPHSLPLPTAASARMRALITKCFATHHRVEKQPLNPGRREKKPPWVYIPTAMGLQTSGPSSSPAYVKTHRDCQVPNNVLLFHHGQVVEMRCLRRFCQWKHGVRGCGWVFNMALSSQVMGWWGLVEGPSGATCAPCSPPASWVALLVSSCSWAASTSAQSPASPQRTAAWRALANSTGEAGGSVVHAGCNKHWFYISQTGSAIPMG